MNRQTLFSIAAAMSLAVTAATHAASSLPVEAPARLMHGQAREWGFKVERPDEPLLIWLRTRIVLPAGEQRGAHGLCVSLNGHPITPETARLVNNKEAVYDGGWGPDKSPSGIPAFDESTGAWYLKADSDEFPYNDGDVTSAYAVANPQLMVDGMPVEDARFGGIRRQHYYEYLWQVAPGATGRDAVITVTATLPDHLSAFPVEISAMRTAQPRAGIVLTSHRPTDFVYPWQAPALDEHVTAPLEFAGCAGEYEAVCFTVYSTTRQEGLTIDVEPLVGPGGSVLPADCIDRAFIWSIPREKPSFPWDPDPVSPEVMKPLPEGGLSLPAGRSQRFVLDAHLPRDLAPGRYQGEAVVRAGENVLRRIPLSLRVHPFVLAPPRQKYWIWRARWSPLWDPDNQACLRDIREHGFHGLARSSGLAWRFSFDDKGALQIDASDFEKGVAALRAAGLELRHHDTGAAVAALDAGLTRIDVRGSLYRGANWFALNILLPEEDEARHAAAGKDGKTDPVSAVLRGEEGARRSEPLPGDMAGLIRSRLPEVEETMVEAMALIKRETGRLGLEYRIFPVDEPDGKPYRRAWTRFVSGIAHRAGLKVWSTHNDPDGWDSGIDESCMGGPLPWAYILQGEGDAVTWPQDEKSRRIRKTIDWNYEQIRSRSMPWTRYILGVESWYYRYVNNITAFVYDQNSSNLYMVYPENGDMFWARPNTPYYGTLGWLAAREGIDDARYLHTLYLKTLERTDDEEAAWRAVQTVLDPLRGVEKPIPGGAHVLLNFGTYAQMRARIVDAILALQP